jgi:peptide deformylase
MLENSKVILFDNPLLSEATPNFDFSNPPVDPVELSNTLIKIMTEFNALGVAANQCGLPYRAFALWSNPSMVCFNPKIVDTSSETISLEEGCLSFPGVLVKIKRPSIIKVRYAEPNGNIVTKKLIGITARAFQHELDHLDGIEYFKRAGTYHYEKAKKDIRLARRKFAKVATQ